MISFKKEIVDQNPTKTLRTLFNCEFKVAFFNMLDRLGKEDLPKITKATCEMVQAHGSRDYASFYIFAWLTEYKKKQKDDPSLRWDYFSPKNYHFKQTILRKYKKIMDDAEYACSIGEITSRRCSQLIGDAKVERFDAIRFEASRCGLLD